MKTVKQCIMLISLLGSCTISSQSIQPQTMIGLGFGIGNIQELKYDSYPNSLIDWSQFPMNGLLEFFEYSWTVDRTPVFAINADIRMNKRFAFGLGLTYDRGNVSYMEEGRTPANGYVGGWLSFWPRYDTVLHYSLEFSRLNVGIRGLCYLYSGGRSELYTGIRGGLTQYTFNSEIHVCNILPPYPIPPSGRQEQLQLQLILMGWNINLFEKLALQFEVAVGQPYSFAMNAGYRL